MIVDKDVDVPTAAKSVISTNRSSVICLSVCLSVRLSICCLLMFSFISDVCVVFDVDEDGSLGVDS